MFIIILWILASFFLVQNFVPFKVEKKPGTLRICFLKACVFWFFVQIFALPLNLNLVPVVVAVIMRISILEQKRRLFGVDLQKRRREQSQTIIWLRFVWAWKRIQIKSTQKHSLVRFPLKESCSFFEWTESDSGGGFPFCFVIVGLFLFAVVLSNQITTLPSLVPQS